MAVASESQERSSSETEVASQHLFLTLSSMLPEAQGVGVIRSHRVAFVTDRLGIMRRQDGRNCHVTIFKVHSCSYLCHSLLVTFLKKIVLADGRFTRMCPFLRHSKVIWLC